MSLYKSFPKYDARRYFCVLESMDRLKGRATLHYIALDTGATRAEVGRAIDALRIQYGAVIEKDESDPVYRLLSWGVLKQKDVVAQLKHCSANKTK